MLLDNTENIIGNRIVIFLVDTEEKVILRDTSHYIHHHHPSSLATKRKERFRLKD
jgi:hypothetical protein